MAKEAVKSAGKKLSEMLTTPEQLDQVPNLRELIVNKKIALEVFQNVFFKKIDFNIYLLDFDEWNFIFVTFFKSSLSILESMNYFKKKENELFHYFSFQIFF